jgi:hypothetical protein
MSTKPTVTIEPEDESESEIILSFLKAERTGPQKPVLAVHELALLRRVAHMLATDSGDARDIASLLELAPRIISPGARPAPKLEAVCAPDAPWDLERLSTQQVLDLETISATAQGRACALPSKRMEATLALALHLDRDGADVIYIRDLMTDILGPALSLEALAPSHWDDVMAERRRVAALESEVERLKFEVSRLEAKLPSNIVALDAARRAEAGW